MICANYFKAHCQIKLKIEVNQVLAIYLEKTSSFFIDNLSVNDEYFITQEGIK